MTTARCDYCGQDVDIRLFKPVPDWTDGGSACYSCRGTQSADAVVRRDAWREFDVVAEQDRIDAARWRALRPFLSVALDPDGGVTRWVELKCVPFRRGANVESIVDRLVEIAQEKQP